MFEVAVKSNIGDVVVKTTENRGLSPEELAERAVEQIVGISSSVDPIVRQQAEAFKSRIYHVILGIIKQAIKMSCFREYTIFTTVLVEAPQLLPAQAIHSKLLCLPVVQHCPRLPQLMQRPMRFLVQAILLVAIL